MNKKIIILSMCIAILIMTIGYSMFISNIKINGTANITSTWNILFTSIKETSKTDGVIVKEEPKASGTLATFNVAFTKPGDSIVYEITVENKGSLNAIINKINATELGSDAIKFEISNIKEGDKLSHGASTTFNVTISYNGEILADPNLKDNELQIDITYIQDLEEKPEKEPDIIPTRLSQKILYDNEEKTDTNINFGEISSDTNGKGLYYTNKNTEDNRVTYYFRGDVKNNYVFFGGFYWRIVRINEDGSIRLIYQGTTANATGSSATIGSSAFNSMLGDNSMVGYMHGTPTTYTDGYGNYSGWSWHSTTGTVKMGTGYTFDNKTGIYTLTGTIVDGTYTETYHNYYTCYSQSTTCTHMIKITQTENDGNTYKLMGGETHTGYWSTSYEQAHKNEVNSAIKTKLEEWYKEHLTEYDSYIADTGFCNDRSLSTGTGIGRVDTHYGPGARLYYNSTKAPQFACPNTKQNLFTVSNEKGNKKSTQKVGLITADEVAYAGGIYGVANSSYYLYTGVNYWTMSSFSFSSAGSVASDWYVHSTGTLYGANVLSVFGVRPVINLASNAEVTSGDGTKVLPYKIKVK